MKKFGIILVIVLLTQGLYAQKWGYIDAAYILEKMPEYAEVQQELDKVSQLWQEEIGAMRQEIQGLYDAYQAEEVLLTEEMKAERLSSIQETEEASKAYHRKVFGYEGLYFLKKKELLKPVQDKLFDAVEKIAKSKRLELVFDKSGDYAIIYSNPVHDYTDFVLEELGLGDKNDVVE
ncbi:MAG: OmpH family outer membrane protein [Cyclobacteriaceae bacterium]|nr:OmpH family outer membrane protein [Cyclobacteriaceae bacterium]